MTDAYAHWRAACAGAATRTDVPQPGLYKTTRHKGGPLVPVQIFLKDEAGAVSHVVRDGLILAGTIDGQPVDAEAIADRWLFMTAVTKADAEHYKSNGVWPGEIGHNAGELSIADQIKDYAANALAWLRKVGRIRSKADSDIAANYRAELLRLGKEADAARETEKRPHLEASRSIDAKYKPLVDEARAAADTLRDELTKWMRAEEARLEAERHAKWEAEQKAAAEQRAAIEAERAKQLRDNPIAALTSPEPELPMAPAAPEPVKVNAGGQRGRAAGLRTVKKYLITDYAAALKHVQDHPDVRAAVEKVAAAQAKAGAVVPGVEVVTEKVAA